MDINNKYCTFSIGEHEFFSILSAVNSRMGSIALVHIEDICNAHIFLMEHAKAEGRYICGVQSYPLSELVDHLAKEYSCSSIPRYFLLSKYNEKFIWEISQFLILIVSYFPRFMEEEHSSAPSEISSKKLKDLGFNYKYGLEDIIHQTINCCLDRSFLPGIRR